MTLSKSVYAKTNAQGYNKHFTFKWSTNASDQEKSNADMLVSLFVCFFFKTERGSNESPFPPLN